MIMNRLNQYINEKLKISETSFMLEKLKITADTKIRNNNELKYIGFNNIDKPLIIDNKVKVLLFYCKDSIDSNFDLMSGMNRFCLVFSSDNDKVSYMTINGGIKWNDSNCWTDLYTLRKSLGDIKWKNEKPIELSYSYPGSRGNKLYKINIKSAKLPIELMDNLYGEDHKTVLIKSRFGYATSTMNSIFNKFKKDGLL